MTIARRETGTNEELDRVRSQLEDLADTRLQLPFNYAQSAHYRQLCNREDQLLGLRVTNSRLR